MGSTNNAPLVSIIITSFNRSKWIETAIQSALSQDYDNIEVIISDNNSTDETDNIIKKYLSNSKIKYFKNETNIGMIPNFKLATCTRAKGDYLTYVSSDDYLNNFQFISQAVSLINKYDDINFVAAKNSTLFDEKNLIVEDESDHVFEKEFMEGMELFTVFPQWLCPGWGAVLMNREKLLQTNIFESRAQSLDYEANLKLMLTGNVAFIKTPSYVFRRHANNSSGVMSFEAHVNNLDFIENTVAFAKKLQVKKDIDSWRQLMYKSYLNTISTVLLKKQEEFNELISYVKREKKINLSLFAAPKLVINSFIYKNYSTFKSVLKIFFSKKNNSIEKILSGN